MWKPFARSKSGSMAVEAALVMSFFLAPMLLGLWNLAQVGLGQAQAQGALQDVITYVAAGNASSSGIQSAAQSAYGNALTASANTVCYCVPTAIVASPAAVSCNGTCDNNSDFEQFMAVTISKTIAMPFNVPYLGNSVTVTASSTIRTG